MALSDWSPNEFSSLWTYANTGKRLSCQSQLNNTSIVGYMVASDLQINLVSDSNHWKSISRSIRGSRINCYELINVQSLQVHGTYGIHSLTEGMRYNVLILVEVLATFSMTRPLICTLIDSSGIRHVSNPYHCLQMPKNQIISLEVGQFRALKSLLGDGEIKFSMVNTDKEMKNGIIIVGALIVPVK